MDNIERAIGNLEGTMKTGFKEINRRLDKTNGTIEDHNDKIDKLETFKDQTEGAKKETTRIAGIGGAIAGGFVTAVIWVATKLFNK